MFKSTPFEVSCFTFTTCLLKLLTKFKMPFSNLQMLKGQGHVTVTKPVISRIYTVGHMWPLCSAQILVDGVNPQERSTNISATEQHTSVSFVSLRNTRVYLQKNTFILRKVVENHCDMAYQKCCKIAVSKEGCLHYVTLPL